MIDTIGAQLMPWAVSHHFGYLSLEGRGALDYGTDNEGTMLGAHFLGSRFGVGVLKGSSTRGKDCTPSNELRRKAVACLQRCGHHILTILKYIRLT